MVIHHLAAVTPYKDPIDVNNKARITALTIALTLV
jgi:hypothetical protein